MSEHDALFGYRLQLVDLAGRIGVSAACRTFGIHRSTYYRWKRMVERHGLGILRPRERRKPRMPNQLSPLVEARIVAFALGHPGLGPARIAAELGRERWGGLLVSHNGIWRCLRRHGLNTREKRPGLVAGYAAPYQLRASPRPARVVFANARMEREPRRRQHLCRRRAWRGTSGAYLPDPFTAAERGAIAESAVSTATRSRREGTWETLRSAYVAGEAVRTWTPGR